MSALIREFKKEHSEILAVLNEVEEFDILSKEGQSKLMSVKMILLKHLNMENVSRVALKFFEKYSRGVLGKKPQEEFENLSVTLRNRIKNEEDLLYKEYERIHESINSNLLTDIGFFDIYLHRSILKMIEWDDKYCWVYQ